MRVRSPHESMKNAATNRETRAESAAQPRKREARASGHRNGTQIGFVDSATGEIKEMAESLKRTAAQAEAASHSAEETMASIDEIAASTEQLSVNGQKVV